MPAVAFLSWAFDVSLVSRCGSFALVMQPNNQLLASPFRVLGFKRTEEGMGASQSGPDRACSGHWIERMNSCQGNYCFRDFFHLGCAKNRQQAASFVFARVGTFGASEKAAELFWEGSRITLFQKCWDISVFCKQRLKCSNNNAINPLIKLNAVITWIFILIRF